MNTKQYFLLIAFYGFTTAPTLFGMDRPLQPTLTLEEEGLKTLSEHCPQAIRIIADNLLSSNPRISDRELLDSYTVKQGGNRLLSKAMLPMIRAIRQDIHATRLKEFQTYMFDCEHIFRPLSNLSPIIEFSKKNTHSGPSGAIRALIIVDSDRNQNKYYQLYVYKPFEIYAGFIANQLWNLGALEEPGHKPYEIWSLESWANCVDSNPQQVIHLKDVVSHDRDALMTSHEYREQLDRLINSKHFVIITTFDPTFINHFKNKAGIGVINAEKPTLKDRLITLEGLAERWAQPAEIIKNLDTINRMIPQEIKINTGELVQVPFATLKAVMMRDSDKFLTNEKFDENKTRDFIANLIPYLFQT